MRSTLSRAALAAVLLAPALTLGQAKPTPIDQISMTPIAASTCAPGKSCVYWSSVDGKLHQRTALGADTVIGTGGGGGGSTGAATSFNVVSAAPGSPSSGDVWYDSTLGTFCGSWAGSTDCFARLGANVFVADQRLEAADVTVGTRSSPKLVLRGKFFSGGSQPLDAALYAVPANSSTYSLHLDLGTSTWRFGVAPSGNSIVGPAGGPLIVSGGNVGTSSANLIFAVPGTYGAGVDAFEWKDGTNVLMALQDDGNRFGVLTGLSKVDVTTLGSAGGNAVMAAPSDGSSGDMTARALVAADLPGTVVFTSDARLAPTPSGGNSGQCVQSNGSAWIAGSCGGSGSLPSAGVAGRIPFDNGASYSLSSAGSSTGLLHGGAAPAFGPVVLGAEVSGVLPIANGGTGASSTAQNFVFAGPTSGSGAPSYRALVAGDLTGPLASVYQPLDSDLTAVAGLSSTGLVARTATGTAAARSLSCSAELTCGNPDGVSGNPTIAITAAGVTNAMLAGSIAASKITGTALVGTDLGSAVQAFDSDLSAVAGLSSTGMMARTGAGTAAVRTLGCNSATCSWTNGDGVSGAPTLALNVGTGANSICAGNDTRLPPAPSGAGKVLYDTGTAYGAVAAGLNGQCLLSGGAGAPTWGSCSTNQNATTLQGRAVSSAAPSDHDVLGWSSSNSDWEPMSTAVCSAHQAIWGQGSASPTCGSSLTNGQLYVGSTGADPVAASITNGGGITATGGAGSITLGSSCGGDLSGTVASATVVAARGKTIAASVGTAGAGQDGYCLKYVHSNTDLELVSCAGGGGGTVTSIGIGTGLASTQTPLTTTGTLSIDQTFSPSWSGAHSFSGIVTMSGGQKCGRRAIADAAATLTTADYLVGYTSITTTRAAQLPNANVGAGTQFLVGDESGSVTPSIRINVTSAGGTIDGIAAGTGVFIERPRCFVSYVSDGTNWHTVEGVACYQWDYFYRRSVLCTSSLTAGGAVDCYFPALPSGLDGVNTGACVAQISVRVVQTGAGGGTVALTGGTTTGGTDVLLSQTLTAGTTTAGTLYGEKGDGSELGSKADSTRSYNLILDGGTTVSLRLGAPAGTVGTAVKVRGLLTAKCD